ncbi:VWFA and cache domain-containing protein CG16868 [Anopheles aquasalis]|uniref:VWFA and cache domain-containing protein CG16868 n=1 Tax=Anopheles aquasalis TaxID=42839 RepID=UPI00215AC167|nr:VWFA and cache domain-containing protein CG16868 [Anopheles aquasalis]
MTTAAPSTLFRSAHFYYASSTLLLLLLAIGPMVGPGCEAAFASNTIFVNNIVPLISNISVSVPPNGDNHDPLRKQQQQQEPKVPSVAISSPSASTTTPSTTAEKSSTTSNYTPIDRVAAVTNGDYGIHELTRLLENTFEHIRNDELDVSGVQKLYDNMEITTTDRDDTELVERMANKLSRKLEQTVSAIEELRRFIQQSAAKHGAKYSTLLNPCPYSELMNPWEDEAPFDLQSFIQSTKVSNATTLAKQLIGGDSLHGSGVTNAATQSTNTHGAAAAAGAAFLDFSAFPANADGSDRPRIRVTDQTLDDNNVYLQHLFNEQSAKLEDANVHYRQQFFLSTFDHASAYKCHYYPRDGRLKALLLSAVRNKHVYILLDIGSKITFDQLEVAKAISKFVLHLLNEHDRVAVVAVGQRTYTPLDDPQQQPGAAGGAASPDCLSARRFVRATMDEKERLVDFIDSLNRTKGATNHSVGFRHAFDSFAELYESHDDELPIVFLYLGRALLPSGSPAATNILQTIYDGQRQLPYPVIINSCLILLDEREVQHEKQLIADISTQNYARYNLSNVIYLPGKMVMIAKHSFDAQRFIVALMEPFLNAGRFIEERLRAHLPYVDPSVQETLVTLSYPVGVHGLVGVDLYLSDLAEHVAYFRRRQQPRDDSYAFLIDLEGNAIMHPSFPRPVAARSQPFYVTNITRLEGDHFTPAYKRMLADPEGNLRINHYGTNRTTVYYWKRALYYIVCLVRTLDAGEEGTVSITRRLFETGPQVRYLHQIPTSGTGVLRSNVEYNLIAAGSAATTKSLLTALLYHRIDIFPPHHQQTASSNGGGGFSICRLVKQLALPDTSSLFLSASSFRSPFAHIRNNREGLTSEEDNVRTIQNIMAYLHDAYGKQLFANPGLQPDVRSDVLALVQILYDYRVRHSHSNLSRYVVRRYAATVNGVLETYPGGLLDSELEPTKRPWFVKAMEYPGRLVVTRPYLDAGGAGYVVSVAYAIYEGSSTASKPPQDDRSAIAVVAMDFTQGFFYKLLLDSTTVCSVQHIKCFLMDDRGYLVAHPMLTEPTLRSDAVRRSAIEHITHKESQVANDILNHKQLVTKKMCYNYVNRTVQRFYQFNMSLAAGEIVTNLMYGEKTKYQITLIPGTNLFLGVVNSTNDGGAFCPCSTVGNSCLNCNRMEQTECECPCECPLDYPTPDGADGACGGGGGGSLGRSKRPKTGNGNSFPIPLCSPLPEELLSMNAINYEPDYEVKSCSSISCEDYTTQNDCLGLVGCEWCQVDVDGESTLNTPFCTSQLACFNGVLGSSTPYGDAAYTSNNMESILPPAYSSIGPVAGAILALCLVVGFAMYCFRQNADQSGASEQLYDDLVADHCHGLPLSRFDLDDGSPSDDCDVGRTNAKQNLLLNGQHNANYMIIPNVASPYQMSSDYRRPPNGAGGGSSSDHGYSTMTHHEESEHLCLTGGGSGADPQGIPGAPNGSGGAKRHSMSDSASISTSVSSPYSNHTGGAGSSFLSKPPVVGFETTRGFTGNGFPPVAGDTMIAGQTTLLPSPTSISRTGVYGGTMLPSGANSTPTNANTPSGHHILVPVTVHRNMEVS